MFCLSDDCCIETHVALMRKSGMDKKGDTNMYLMDLNNDSALSGSEV